MGQREYDDFKLLVKEWKDSHPEEYRIMRQCLIKTFRNALQAQYEDIRIVNERGIQRAYQNLTTPLGPNRKLMKDTGDDRAAIEELKAFLSD